MINTVEAGDRPVHQYETARALRIAPLSVQGARTRRRSMAACLSRAGPSGAEPSGPQRLRECGLGGTAETVVRLGRRPAWAGRHRAGGDRSALRTLWVSDGPAALDPAMRRPRVPGGLLDRWRA